MSFEVLLTLQALDTRLDQLRYRRTHHDTLAERQAATEALAAAEAAVAEVEAERALVQAELDRLEAEAAAANAKIAKHTDTLYSGTVVAHKDLESLQTEIAMLTERVSEFEDHELEQMELLEPIDATLAERLAARDQAAAALESAEHAVTAMLAETDVEHDAVVAERASVASTVEAALLARYDDLRNRLGGQGAARLAAGGRCEGCHLTLPSAEYSELKRAPADEVITCPECGRILVR